MKNQNILVTIIILGIVLFFTNCTRDNFLDFKPRGVIIPDSHLEYRNLLDQLLPYAPDGFTSEGISRGFGGTHSLTSFYNDNQDVIEDLLQDFGLLQNAIRAYTYQDNLYSVLEDDLDWSNYYNQIYTANVILEGLATATGTDEEIAELVAEARLHRAYAYFHLVNIYSVHYNPTTAATDLGVPIREGTQINGLDLTRASVQETYDYILKDILESYNDLKDFQAQEFRFRPSKAGASGLLARIYLYQGKYELALEAANTALSYNSIITPIELPSDSIVVYPIATEDEQVIWYKYYDVEYPIFISNSLYRQYVKNDYRRYWYVTYEWYFNKPRNNFIFIPVFFSGIHGTVGITSVDMLLINAECHARLGNIPETNASLNALREKRFNPATYEPIFIKRKSELLDAVKAERRREMVGAMQRSFDVKRYNLFDNDGITITHTLGGVTATIQPNSLNWAMPIASKYIQQNPEIVQNPRD